MCLLFSLNCVILLEQGNLEVVILKYSHFIVFSDYLLFPRYFEWKDVKQQVFFWYFDIIYDAKG